MTAPEPEETPVRIRRFRWLRLVTGAAALAAILACLFALVRYGPQTPIGLKLVEQRLDGLRVGRLGRLKVQGLSGDPWTNLAVQRLTIVDAKGVWLEARGVRLVWRAPELWQRRLHITQITARGVTALRRPLASDAGKPGRESPVSVRIDQAAARVEMAPEFAATRGLYEVSGALDLERHGLVKIQVRQTSLLHPGDFLTADVAINRGKTFVIAVDAREAQGGAIGGMAGLPTSQPFFLTVRAKGSLAAGQFRVDSRSGATTPLRADGTWNAGGGSARGTVQLAASSLLERYRAMIGPDARFEIAGRRLADGLYDLTLAAAGENATLQAHGEADVTTGTTGAKGLALDLKVADLTRITRYPKMGAGRVTAVVTGDLKTWRLSGSATAENLSESGFNLERVSGPVTIESRHGELAIEASAAGAGGAGHGLLAAVLGGHPSGSAQLTVFSNGRLLMRKLILHGDGLEATATGERGWLGDLGFKGEAEFSNLAMAHGGAKGLVHALFTARQSSGDKPWLIDMDAKGDGLAAGFGEADRLLGATPRLRATASYAQDVLTVTGATLEGASGSALAQGAIGPGDALGLKLTWQAKGPFGLGPLEFDGAAKGSGDIAGTFDAPRADLAADFSAVNLPELPLRAAHLTLVFARIPAGGDGTVRVTADSDYGPADAGAMFRFTDHGVELSGADIKAGGVIASGDVSLNNSEPSSADLTFSVGTGAFLSQGRVEGSLKVLASAAGRHVSLSVKAADVVTRQGGLAVRAANLTADGPLRRLPYSGHADGATAAGAWRINGDGFLERSGSDRLLTFSGSGRIRRAEIATRGPAEIRIDAQHRQSAKASLTVGAGRADVAVTRQAGVINGKATLSGLSLALFDEDLVGQVSGTVDVAGQRDQLAGDLEARLTGAGGRDLKGSPPVDGLISAKLGGGAMVLRARFDNTEGLKASGDVTLPVESSAAPFRIAVNTRKPFSGRFAVDGEIKPLFELALGGAQSLSGRLSASGTLGGTLADPRIVGAVALDDGGFQDGDTGLKLAAVHLRASMADGAVDVSSFTATDGAQGTVAGSGRANLDRDGASSFSVDLKGFRLLDNDVAHATASGRVTVNRAASGKVQLSGAVTVDKALISAKASAPTGVVPMDVVEIHRPEDVEGRFSPPPESRDAPLGLDVTVKAANGVAVKGRGLNLDLAIDAHVGGTTETPILTGNARVVRGDYDFAGQRFTLDDRSVIRLGTTAETIRLDLTATRDDPTLTAVIKIAGTAAKPTITLSSTPVLPQDEILSQVLFGASAAQLNGFQAAQLASALAGLSGGGGFDVIGGLRTFAHLDRLAIGGTSTTGTTVSGGKYIGNRLYLELTGGTREGEGAQLEWRVKKHVSLVSKLGSQGDSQVSVRWRKDY